MIRSLGYLRWRSADSHDWRDFATRILGMWPADIHERNLFRMDDRAYRLSISAGTDPGIDGLGFEVAGPRELDFVASRLSNAGVDVSTASVQRCDELKVTAMIQCFDPAGIPIEIFHSALTVHDRSHSGVASGYVTGDMGMGHVVVTSNDYRASVTFYTELLGFQLRNTMRVSRGDQGGSLSNIAFLGCNPRHHTVGVLEHPQPGLLRHFMIEMETLDDVGSALDRCLANGVALHQTLGRHTNDLMTSFYVKAPDGIVVEVGCDGRRVDSSTWVSHEIATGSFWGHHMVGPVGVASSSSAPLQEVSS